MVKANLKFQISVFGDAGSVSPTPDNIKKCIDVFFSLGLLPANVQEVEPGASKPVARLALQSTTTGLLLQFLSGRLDIVQPLAMGAHVEQADIEGFYEEAKKLIALVEQTFSLRFNRAALICEYLYEVVDPGTLEKIRARFMPDAFSPIEGVIPFEWNFRSVINGLVGGEPGELSNIIFAVSRTKLQIGTPAGIKDFEGIHVAIDINSVAENTQFRFDADSSSRFLTDAKLMHDKVLNKVGSVLNG